MQQDNRRQCPLFRDIPCTKFRWSWCWIGILTYTLEPFGQGILYRSRSTYVLMITIGNPHHSRRVLAKRIGWFNVTWESLRLQGWKGVKVGPMMIKLGQVETFDDDVHDRFPFRHCTYTYESGLNTHRNTCRTGNEPISPHANFFPIGPTILYPITSFNVRRCCSVNGCSNISVFMAGNMYVGVVGESARIREVYQHVIP